MTEKSNNYKVRLGLFITAGIALFFLAIFFIGRQKNLFDPRFQVFAYFKNVSGLQVGNTVRFSGINVGTVEGIIIKNDTTVRVEMLIKKDVQKFIRTDSEASIGSEGIIGNRIITISSGAPTSPVIKERQLLASNEPTETDAIIESLSVTADNAAVATGEISEMLTNINSGRGTLGRLIRDTTMAGNIDKTIVNLRTSTKKLDQNMEAAKHNFLLRGYFRKQEKAKKEKEEKAREAAEEAAEKKEKEKSDKKKK
ncbi:MlaD family protein [Flavobacterium silvaticum]|uniref:MCE family protein n=1 Tax=Flavobacterium silvaticum TaxID=1852020 RepID=A0A972FNG9_9FLAO|nr:MlaD family protein [Flavobacterium silvaticum]NMH28922.1 MCE family protein [Flavobacterium silvaticum]